MLVLCYYYMGIGKNHVFEWIFIFWSIVRCGMRRRASHWSGSRCNATPWHHLFNRATLISLTIKKTLSVFFKFNSNHETLQNLDFWYCPLWIENTRNYVLGSEGPFTYYVTHFLLFFDHPPTHGNALAIILLMTYITRVCYI